MNTRFEAMPRFFMLSITFPLACWLLFCFYQPFQFELGQLMSVLLFSLAAALMVFLLHIFSSFMHVRDYINPFTGQVNISKLWVNHSPIENVAMAFLLMAWVHVALLGMPMIADWYRQSANVWYDNEIWMLEKPFFLIVRSVGLASFPPSVWDEVYNLMWVGLITSLALLVFFRRDASAMKMAVATVLMFYIGHLFALIFPTVGPAIFKPNQFEYLNGTLSLEFQKLLYSYQNGRIQQNGLL